jgi:mannitol/fructose-specific phosphotransferase system IIA component (Ntr-type)
MGGICKRLLPACVVMDSREKDKESLIRLLVDTLDRVHTIGNKQQLLDDVLERERFTSTCLGFGCAVPHTHTTALESTLIAAARLDPPLEADTPDGEPISLMFLMVGPVNNAGLHIRLLSKLARLLHESGFRQQLRQAKTSEEFHRLVCEKDE